MKNGGYLRCRFSYGFFVLVEFVSNQIRMSKYN